MSRAVIAPCRRVCGSLSVPGDKSISHRAVFLGSVAEGRTTVSNFLDSADCRASLQMFRDMGVSLSLEDNLLQIDGCGPSALKDPPDVLQAGNSGTTTRLMLGLLAGLDIYAVISGDASLRRRPMDRLAVPLSQRGALILGRGHRCQAPLTVQGHSRLAGLDYTSPVASAQVKTALLFSGLWADEPTLFREPSLSRDHGERMLAAFGADIDRRGNDLFLRPGRQLRACELTVPGDISSASFLLVLAAAYAGSELTIRDVGVNPTRSGILDVLTEMGASLQLVNQRQEGGEPLADIQISGSGLSGVTVQGEMIPRLIDEIPVLAVAAALAEGRTVIRDAAELRVKESDRIATTAAMLRAFGVKVAEMDDGLVIDGGGKPGRAVIDSHGDHRIAMAAAVAGCLAADPVTINGVDCVETSFPGFFRLLKEVTGTD